MQVLINLEIVICFHLKYATDFEKVINTAKTKTKTKTVEGFLWLPVNGFPMQMYSTSQVLLSCSYWKDVGLAGNTGNTQPCSGVAKRMHWARVLMHWDLGSMVKDLALCHCMSLLQKPNWTAVKKEVMGEQVRGTWPLPALLLRTSCPPKYVLPKTIPSRTRMASSPICTPSSMWCGSIYLGKLSKKPNV